MKAVAVKELKNGLSRYLRGVKHGEVVLIETRRVMRRAEREGRITAAESADVHQP